MQTKTFILYAINRLTALIKIKKIHVTAAFCLFNTLQQLYIDKYSKNSNVLKHYNN